MLPLSFRTQIQLCVNVAFSPTMIRSFAFVSYQTFMTNFCTGGYTTSESIFAPLYIAFRPEVTVTIPESVNRNIYANTSTGAEIEIGREFEVLCSSSGEFPGRAVWFKKQNGGKHSYIVNLLCEVHLFQYCTHSCTSRIGKRH